MILFRKMFNKKKLYIKNISNYLSTEDIIQAPQKPKWFSKLCPFSHQKKTLLDAYKDLNDSKDLISPTLRACPAINELFKKSILILFPCDVILETKEDGQWFFNKPSINDFINVMEHTSVQHDKEVNLDQYIILKFQLPLLFQSPHNSLIFLDPILFNSQPYQVCPGVISFANNNAVRLNVIVLFKKEDKIYQFKKNSILALLYSVNMIEIKENEKLKNYTKTSFLKGWIN